jgi:glyoxylase-like metal-dependent hydrolase (beta-lactamase superfamily II)/8-oxo-dGTP pyrophosphatase MutT (NUDIX family)
MPAWHARPDRQRPMSSSPGSAAFDVFAGARKAASLIIIRDDATQGLQVLMLRRAERDGDMRSGACVFPGGVVDAADAQAAAFCDGLNDAQASAALGLPEGGLAYWVAAVRESFEEVGLLFAGDRLPNSEMIQWRDRLQNGSAKAAAWAQHFGLRFPMGSIACFSHWLTPPGHPKRFDTRFFITRAPAGQVASADMGEAVELMWVTPSEALSRERGFKLLPVTRRTLEQLQRYGTVDAALAAVQAQGPQPLVMPRVGLTAKGPRILLPEDHAYAEVAKLDPTGRQDAFADIEPGRVVRFSERVLRITAPNPGVMTGPGTNSYLVAEPNDDPQAAREWTLIDPGPVSEAHTQVLLAAALPGRIVRILVTHTHRDHSPGAVALAQATGAPLVGRIAQYPQGQDASFEPQRQPHHGEQIELGPSTRLTALHTPGHASNHLCWWLEAEGLLFTGDQVMQGSTVVINPPDGDMAAYLASLRDLCRLPLQWLAPGHGFLVAHPLQVIEALIAHRLKREAKVLAALQPHAQALASLVLQVYDDVPAALHPVAQRSLLAHLLKLLAEGRAQVQGEPDSTGAAWALAPAL